MEKFLEDFLVSAPVFRQLGEYQRRNIHRSAIGKHYREGEYLAHYGDPWPYVFVVAKGMVAVRKFSSEGRSMGALRLMPGQSFWSPTIFDGNPLPASLEARADGDIYLWRQDDLLPLVRQSPDALWDLCALLISRIRQASEIVEDLAFQSVNGRLAGLLYKQYHENKDVHIPRTLTLDEMAGIIGTTPVMVCKILSNFAADGLIAVKRTEFEVANPERLREIAGREK
jgi:CRP/FNR family transcriptional regulator